MRFIKVLLLIVIFTCGLLFFIQNSKELETALTLKFSLYYILNLQIERKLLKVYLMR